MKNKNLTNSCSTGSSGIWHKLTGIVFLLTVLCFACRMPEHGRKGKAPEQHPGPPRVIIHTGNNQIAQVQVELAVSNLQLRQGLMYRKSLPEFRGMLFMFPFESHQTFWMKNTLIPLDLIFIGEDMKVREIIENAAPESEQVLSIEQPSRYVLEVNASYSSKHGVKAGDLVEFRGIGPEK